MSKRIEEITLEEWIAAGQACCGLDSDISVDQSEKPSEDVALVNDLASGPRRRAARRAFPSADAGRSPGIPFG